VKIKKWCLGNLPGVKQWGRQFVHWPLSDFEVKNEWIPNSSPVTCFRAVEGDSYTFWQWQNAGHKCCGMWYNLYSWSEYIALLLNKRYNSCTVLAFSTIFFYSWRSWACSVHLWSFIFLRSFLTSSSHLCLGLPTSRVIYGCHLYIFFTMLVSGFLYM
jgi:hypothetical protein